MQEVVGTTCELWREMMGKFIIACCVFSFVLGGYSVLIVNKHREASKSCQVAFSRGNITTVHIGEWK